MEARSKEVKKTEGCILINWAKQETAKHLMETRTAPPQRRKRVVRKRAV